MAQRIELQRKLEALLGSKNVYFQPPANVQLQYPCIIYHLDGAFNKYADDNHYVYKRRYQMTYVDRSPDSPLVDILATQQLCALNNWSAVDGLNHYYYSIYF